MAAWIATEFWSEFKKDVGITLIPADDGRLEIVLGGEVLFDRKAEGGVYPGLDKVRAMKKIVREKLEQLSGVS